MTVKDSAPIAPATGVDDALQQLVALMGAAIPALKRSGSPPPQAFASLAGDTPDAERGALGPRHGPLLVAVALERDRSVSELAARVGLSVSTVSLMVGELTRAGLVERFEDERDRRRTLVHIHPDHAAEVEAWVEERMVPMRRTLDRLSPQVRDHFLEGWRVLAEEVLAVARETGDPGGC